MDPIAHHYGRAAGESVGCSGRRDDERRQGKMCFGPSSQQKNLNNILTSLIPSEIAKRDTALDPLAAFAKARMMGGLPDFNALKDFSSGTVAANSAPARGGVIRRLAAGGLKLSDPASQGILSDFDASRSRAYDSNLMDLIKQNEAAKQAGASNLAAVGAARNPIPALSLYRDSALS